METPRNFTEFWDFYVLEHSAPRTRTLHFIGTMSGLIIGILLIWSGYWFLIPFSLIPSYGLAWYSHFYIEHNKPATFKYPLWSLICDWKMVWLMLTGRMQSEIERINRSSRAI